jgi:hypothetical protein
LGALVGQACAFFRILGDLASGLCVRSVGPRFEFLSAANVAEVVALSEFLNELPICGFSLRLRGVSIAIGALVG